MPCLKSESLAARSTPERYEYLQVLQRTQKSRDDKIALQTAIDVLSDNQRVNGKL
jgi:hypothetical protein